MSRNLKTPLVLIVDDDLTTTQILDGLLRGAGFDTLCAYDLASAEALARSRPVSLILLDVHLPDGNGLDLCSRLTAEPEMADVPILFISANSEVETVVRGFAAGGVDFIPKPLAGAVVLARVRTHLRLRAANETLIELQTEQIQRLATSQQSLMPLPQDLPEARFHACVRQALRAGGDFYDVVPSGNRVTDYVVADASGHDLGVSLWTASFKTLLAEFASTLHTPLNICRLINSSLRRVLPDGAYFTTIYARLNRTTNKLTLVNAGHPSTILVSAQTREACLLPQEGDLIGIFPDAGFGVLEVSVLPGDRLFLYSDGLVERDGSRDDGTRRLEDACRSTADLPLETAVPSIVEILCGSNEPEDDVVLLGVVV
jgi:sigma-B regulation protein RsbU (phosphoserine phosphatase)